MKKPEWPEGWPPPMVLGRYIMAVLAACSLFFEGRAYTEFRVAGARDSVRAEASRYISRLAARVDTLTTHERQQDQLLKRLAHRQQIRDRLQPLQMEFIGPPAPRRRNVFKRIWGFLSAPAEGGG